MEINNRKNGKSIEEVDLNTALLNEQNLVDKYEFTVEKFHLQLYINICKYRQLQKNYQWGTMKRHIVTHNVAAEAEMIKDDACAFYIIKVVQLGNTVKKAMCGQRRTRTSLY